ncbi:hypothetical protein [Cypionkella sp.]|uniref:hypothetical protein n=1 Tax=Cypionkella sp. TaxID=2811411 RepID=UPI002AC8F135|nr:hypothetical protein [Cypionkella sp.]
MRKMERLTLPFGYGYGVDTQIPVKPAAFMTAHEPGLCWVQSKSGLRKKAENQWQRPLHGPTEHTRDSEKKLVSKWSFGRKGQPLAHEMWFYRHAAVVERIASRRQSDIFNRQSEETVEAITLERGSSIKALRGPQTQLQLAMLDAFLAVAQSYPLHMLRQTRWARFMLTFIPMA